MEQKFDLKLSILIQISELTKTQQIDYKDIKIDGFDMDRTFNVIKELYEDGFVFAQPIFDETQTLVHLDNIVLSPKGKRYIKEHS